MFTQMGRPPAYSSAFLKIRAVAAFTQPCASNFFDSLANA